MLTNAPSLGSAISLIKRELYLFRSSNGYPIGTLSVPKYLYEQFIREAKVTNIATDKLDGTFIEESRLGEFTYSLRTTNEA